jgi:hypothetical protein
MAALLPVIIVFAIYAGMIFLLSWAVERASKRLERSDEPPKSSRDSDRVD